MTVRRTPIDVLVLFECSGTVREAFRQAGFSSISCDLKPCEDGSPHHVHRALGSSPHNRFPDPCGLGLPPSRHHQFVSGCYGAGVPHVPCDHCRIPLG